MSRLKKAFPSKLNQPELPITESKLSASCTTPVVFRDNGKTGFIIYCYYIVIVFRSDSTQKINERTECPAPASPVALLMCKLPGWNYLLFYYSEGDENLLKSKKRRRGVCAHSEV